MHDALLVRGREAVRELHRVLDRLARRERSLQEALSKRFSVEQLHYGVDTVVLPAEIENCEDIRMRERRHRPGFPLEPRERLGVIREVRRQDLDGHVPSEFDVARAVNLAHPARAEGRRDLVRAQSRPGGNCHPEPGEILRPRGLSIRGAAPQRERLLFEVSGIDSLVTIPRSRGAHFSFSSAAGQLRITRIGDSRILSEGMLTRNREPSAAAS